MAISLKGSIKKKSAAEDQPIITIYGVPKIGKSSLAAEFPRPVFIQTAAGESVPAGIVADTIEVRSYNDLCEAIGALVNEEHSYATAIFDSTTEGDDAMFDAIVYEISIRELIEKGFLCPLVSKATATAKTMVDLSKLRRSGGEFTDKSLKAVFDQGEITRAAVDEIIGYAASNERPRRSWLLFCAGVEHAFNVRDAIRERGYSCETIHGGMEKGDCNRILEDLKSGKLTSVTNFGVLTTGTNIKRLDLIALLRATDSTQPYVQMCGRGTRLLGDTYEESVRNGKEDCLVLDFGGNVRRHGPIDRVTVKKPGKGGGEPRVPRDCSITKSSSKATGGC